MVHSQLRTPMHTNNQAVHFVVTKNIHPRRTNTMNIHLRWLRCLDAQGHFRYNWRTGKNDWTEYWTKHQPASYCRAKIYKLFAPTCQLELLRSAKSRTKKERTITNISTTARVWWTGEGGIRVKYLKGMWESIQIPKIQRAVEMISQRADS